MPTTTSRPFGTFTATPTDSSGASSSTSLSAGAIAGIVIGSVLGSACFAALILYLLKRYTRHRFTRVANPAHDAADLSRTNTWRTIPFTRRSHRPSISNEPLMSPASWPPIPATSRVLPPATPPRLDVAIPGVGHSPSSSFDFGEISQIVASGTASRSAIPAHQTSFGSSRSSLGNTPPHARQTSGDGRDSPSTPTKANQALFVHRALQSRARASESVSVVHRPSVDLSQSRSTTLDPSDVRADEERSFADTADGDAGTAQRGGEEMAEGVEDCGDVESIESIYSQGSAPLDHSRFLSEPGSLLLPHRRSFRRQARTPALPTDLSPVAELPETSKASTVSRSVSIAANSSLGGRVSHGTASCPMSPVVDQLGTISLLTSVNFGKGSTTSGSISSMAGRGSSSSGGASRYPSLSPSSIGLSLGSGSRSDVGTDWHHPPSGLAGLTSLQVAPLLNPYSPVEERPGHPDALLGGRPAPVKLAHLREGTTGSIPEVERRDVMQGGIAHIDVAL